MADGVESCAETVVLLRKARHPVIAHANGAMMSTA